MQVTDPYQLQNRKSLMWLAAGVLLLAVVAAFGASSGGSLLAFGRPTLMAMTVEGNAPPSTLIDQGAPRDPMVLDQGRPTEATHLDQAPAMPKEIFDWLKHLEKCENARKDISLRQVSSFSIDYSKLQGTGTLDPESFLDDAMSGGDATDSDGSGTSKDPTRVANSIEEKRKEWTDLVAFFRTMPPPDECAEAASLYDECLTETQVNMMTISEMIEQPGESDPTEMFSKLAKIYSSHKETIDKPGVLTDVQVQKICAKYGTRKWFSVNADYGNDLLSKIFGGFGGGLGGFGGSGGLGIPGF